MEALCEEYTHGELEDQVYFRPSFFPLSYVFGGKPEDARSGVAKGLQ